jgi:hypothetical protein
MRAWELLCGAMLAVTPVSSVILRPWVYQAVSLAGLIAILTAVCGFDKLTLFPGWAALLPVLGAAALIGSNGQAQTWVGNLLSASPLVAVGLISYSLYLWHWPVLVYANAISIDGMQRGESLFWIALCGVLAWLSWRFVEMPFREKRLLARRKPMLIGAALCILMVALAGQAVRWADGFPLRLSGQARQYAQARDWQRGQMECLLQRDSPDLAAACRLGGNADVPPLQLVWGDSHAAALMPAIEEDARRYGIPVWLTSLSGCLPIQGIESRPQCQAFNQQNLTLVEQQKVRDVVLAARWSLYLYGEEDGDREHMIYRNESRAAAEQHLAEALRTTLARLRAGGADVWLFKEIPLQRQGTIARLSSLAMIGRSAQQVGRPIADHRQRQHFIDELFASLAASDSHVHVLDPAPLLCVDGICRAAIDGYSLYKDENHLSDQGGERMKPLFAPIFLGENIQ